MMSHMLIKIPDTLEERAFIGSLRFYFEMMAMPLGLPCKPVEPHCMGLYVSGDWYHLKMWPEWYEKKEEGVLSDLEFLEEKVLGTVLGMKKPYDGDTVQYVSCDVKLRRLQEMAAQQGAVAFALYVPEREA